MNQSILRKSLKHRYYNATLYIIAINILVFFLTYVSPRTLGYLVLNPLAVTYRNAYWQFVTYMFVHGGIRHILFNMLGLFFFGAHVERQMGSNEFVLFYMLTGVLAGVFSFIVFSVSGSTGAYLLGASGAVYAVLLAYATYYPRSLIYVMGIIPIRASVMVLIFTAIALFSEIFSFNNGVAHLTHLAGFGFAFIYFIIRFGTNPIHSLFGDGRRRWR